MKQFEFSNYAQIAKVEKSAYNALKKSIFSIFQTLGKCGSSIPVAYDTAWAARVPKFDDLAQPAFPQCLQWLRDHQREDGSWGEDHPRSVHGKILNTFTTVLALSQWKLEEDEERIKKGVDVMWKMSEELPREKTENSTFEMILSALIDDARILDLNIPYESYEWFATIGREKVKMVKRNILTNKPNPYWAILEAAGRTLDLQPTYYRSEIKRYGLIAAQPSTTAFILRQARLKGENYVEADWTLERLSWENNGGLPHLCFCENFDLIHSLDVLTKVGINPITNDKHEAARNAIEALQERWDSDNGVGFSSRWQFPDYNCTKVAANVLEKTLKKQNDPINVGMHVGRFPLNRKLQTDSYLAQIANQPSGVEIIASAEPFRLKCLPFLSSVSKYYHFMQAVFEPSQGTTSTLPYTLETIVKSQNSDGGWGYLGVSSAGETAYVCIAIFELIRHNSEILYNINFLQLVHYIQSAKISFKDGGTWYWKVSFSSPGVSEAALIAAKYAVFQIQRKCIMTDILNYYKLDFDDVTIFNDANEVLFHGNILRFDVKSWPENTENRKMVMDNLLSIFSKTNGASPYVKVLIDTSSLFSYLQHPIDLSLEHRTIEIVGFLILFLLDDIVDLYHSDENDIVDGLEEMFCSIIDILEDKNRDPVAVPIFDSPEFSTIIEAVFFFHNAVKKNGWDCKNYVKALKNLFDVYILVRKDHRNQIEHTAERYLQLSKVHVALDASIQKSFMIDGITGSTESEHLGIYKQFLNIARKVARLANEPFSIEKDMTHPMLDNFCLRLKHQYKMSVEEAIQMTIKKMNKEILKMHTLKKMIQNDPNYIKYTDLSIRLKYVDTFADACYVWGLRTSRYAKKWTKSITRIEHEKKNITFVQNLCFGV